MTNTTTDTKQGQSLTVSENKTAQNVQNKGNKMKRLERLDRVEVKNNQKIDIKIGENSFVDIVKLENGSVSIDIRHHNTSAAKRVQVQGYSDFNRRGVSSWSQCSSSFREDKTKVIVSHTAYNK
jgi:hypothetical protein